eukprot:SAG25_NODE_323_length_9809_cov_4.314212_8_plen_81_part_00
MSPGRRQLETYLLHATCSSLSTSTAFLPEHFTPAFLHSIFSWATVMEVRSCRCCDKPRCAAVAAVAGGALAAAVAEAAAA